ncbi:MAG TPA: LOG family protein [Patescibacteria group bacterium]|nr:LOG family protein [Patescibacteria group bacterium]
MIITVFGSSRARAGSPEYEEARDLGRALAASGLGVCSGGYGGVMEAVSRGAREAGGEALAVTSRTFRGRANSWVTREVQMDSWQERLFELVRRGQGYVVCRGGTGTLVELAVVWEMLNKGLMRSKPLAVLGGFWLPVIEQVNLAETGKSTVGPTRGDLVVFRAGSPGDAARFLAERIENRRSAR